MYLAEKLLAIRTERLKVSQSEMLRLIGEKKKIPARVSEWENGKREPDLLVILGYSRAAKLNMEDLVDDRLSLPK